MFETYCDMSSIGKCPITQEPPQPPEMNKSTTFKQ